MSFAVDTEDRAVLALEQRDALAEALRILHDHFPAEVEALRARFEYIPTTPRDPHRFGAYVAALLLIVARRQDQLHEQTKKRPRGRPPKRKE